MMSVIQPALQQDERAGTVVPAEHTRAQVEKVLASPHFRNSKRCSSLLSYVIEAMVEGRLDSLKERVIGAAVFGREPDYDTNQDAVVRNAAAEVRKRLALYYLEPGHDHELRFDLPAGSYLPEVHQPLAPAVPEALAADRGSRTWWIASTVFLVLAGVLVAVWAISHRSAARTELDEFWAPVVDAPGMVQICVGQSSMSYLPERIPDGATSVPVSRLVPVRDRFLYLGDSLTMAKLTGYLMSRGKQVNLRVAERTPYSELRGRAAVLVGAFNNEWTVRLTEGLRFSLAAGSDPSVRGVRDREKGPDLVWRMERSPSGWIAEEDYALVTRLFDPNTEQVVVAAGGIGHYGTMAAGDFLANPDYFRSALRGAPADWASHNMQFVLKTRVVEKTAGPPAVVATYFW